MSEFTRVQLDFLHRLIDKRPPTRRAGQGSAAVFFADQYSIGTVIGGEVHYRDKHFAAATSLLAAHDLPTAALGPVASRADVADYGGMSEKTFSVAPHSRSVAVKALGSCLLDGRPLWTPEGAYSVLTPEQALRVTCTRIMPLENLETFRFLEAYTWIDRQGQDVLVIYRGDQKLSNKDALEVILGRSEPLWAFYDFDPAGLALASRLDSKRLERLVLPPQAWLAAAADSARGRQLYDSQVRQYAQALDSARHPHIAAAWQTLRRLKAGVTQERMRSAPDGRTTAWPGN